MFEFIKKIRLRKKEIEGPIINPIYEESNFDITVEESPTYTKVTISDYARMQDYGKCLQEENNSPAKQISMNILWNSSKQRINKGTYYIITIGNRLYNILINDNNISIDERTHHTDSTDERIIKFNTETNDYYYSSLKHDSIGSTKQTKFYSKTGTQMLGFALSQEEAASEINPLFEHIELLPNIETILPLNLLKSEVLNHINNPDTNKSQK